MKGAVIARGSLGWGNRKTGLEAYGPYGRWATARDMPERANENVRYGDLLGDHLDECGCHEGAQLIVLAFPRTATDETIDNMIDQIRFQLGEWIEAS